MTGGGSVQGLEAVSNGKSYNSGLMAEHAERYTSVSSLFNFLTKYRQLVRNN